MLKSKLLDSTKQKVLFVLIILTLAVIWIHSTMPPETSSLESNWVTKVITPLLEIFLGKGMVTEHLVRKLAHFCEFAILGIELVPFLSHAAAGPILLSWNYSILAALIDESIQLFSGRGSAVLDIWLDFSGAFTGTIVAVIFYKLKNSSKSIINNTNHLM